MKPYSLALIATTAFGVQLRRVSAGLGPKFSNPHSQVDAYQYDVDGDGKLDLNEFIDYALALGKEPEAEAAWTEHARVEIEQAISSLQNKPYDMQEAQRQLREKHPEISDVFAYLLVEADYEGDQDYQTTYAEFYSYLNAHQDQFQKFDIEELKMQKAGLWDTECVLDDPLFIQHSIKDAYIDGYVQGDPSTWQLTSSQVYQFTSSPMFTQQAIMDLQNRLGEPVVAPEQVDEWLDTTMFRTNYRDIIGIVPSVKEMLAEVDQITGNDSFISVEEMIDGMRHIASPAYIDSYLQKIQNGDVIAPSLTSDGVGQGTILAEILVSIFTGDEIEGGIAYIDGVKKIEDLLDLKSRSWYKEDYHTDRNLLFVDLQSNLVYVY